MRHSVKLHCRPIKPKPQTPMDDADMNDENEPPTVVNAPSIKVANRYMPEKWADWELKFVRKWFASDQNPSVPVRNLWALFLTQEYLRRSNLNRKSPEKGAWYEHYRRRLTNWFKNARAGLKHGKKIPGLSLVGDGARDTPLSSTTTPRALCQSPFDTGPTSSNKFTLTPYSADKGIYDGDTDSDKEGTPTPKIPVRPLDDVPIPSLPVKVASKATLEDLADLAVQALERRKYDEFPGYDESVVHGAYLLMNLKYNLPKKASG